MGRVIFKDAGQKQFFENLKTLTQLSIKQLASICNVSPRTFRDWIRGKYNISETALNILIKKFSINLPEEIKIVEDYWYAIKGAREGGLKRLELYGPPGTVEGRRKGGINSQLRRKENPLYFKLLGCNLRKDFNIDKPSIEFAEAAGIILGDGGLTNSQLKITLSLLVDRPYSYFVSNLFHRVFKEKPSLLDRRSENVINLTISGINLIEELKRRGFQVGNKVKNQVDFPTWIWKDIEFQKACVRGLMDTDGGCYFHKHMVNKLSYLNFGMCFTSHSLPIAESVSKVLKSLDIKFSICNKGKRIYIYSFKEIEKYFSVIGSNNPKNQEKYEFYSSLKSRRIDTIGEMQEWFNWRSWKDRVGANPP